MTDLHTPVVIVGGGPSGLTAATALAHYTRVIVLEREAEAGGVPRHCDHTGFGLRDLRRNLTGPKYAKRLVQNARDAGAEIWTNAMVTGWAGERVLDVTAPQGRMRLSADAIVLATGARERPRSARRIPGDRPAGVFTTGQLQQAVHLRHQPIGSRAVVVGSELVSWSAVLTLREANCRTVLMTTEYEQPDVYAALAIAGRLWFRPNLQVSTRVVRIIGKQRVTAVEIEHVPTGRRTVVECDTVVFTGDWIPDHELARMRDLEIDSATLGPAVDAAMRTSAPGIFAVGNLLHPVDTGDAAAIDGRQVADAVLAHLEREQALSDGLHVRALPPLRWVAPTIYRSTDPDAPRGRLLAWSDAFKQFPTIEVRQADRLIATRRSIWPAVPGRVFRMPWSMLRNARPTDGPIDVTIR